MNIDGIHGSGPIVGNPAIDPKPRRHSSIPPAEGAPAARTHISGPGQLFSQLSELSQSDPTKFKEVAQNISDQFKAAAETSTGHDSERLQKLADRFGQAAQTGNLSAFQAEGAHGAFGHHHHHHHGHTGGNDAMRSVLESALDMVHEALAAPSGTSTAATTPAAGTESTAATTPAADTVSSGAAPSESSTTPTPVVGEAS